VSLKEGSRFAEEFGCRYIETSAKENMGISELFEYIAMEISKNLHDEIKEGHKLREENEVVYAKKSTCC